MRPRAPLQRSMATALMKGVPPRRLVRPTDPKPRTDGEIILV